ncbi:MAG: PhoD-like phosphatase [Symploca sp. SIO1C4]|uniref:PhoD-like phosphatase n=1 Tax=Symploca sp. SIO1C4 TaxID=2607765 RepID=A0A6B3NMV9_9CYAN|nr:PhoD-like phosphatase [Symploca sp. SIO1C4]
MLSREVHSRLLLCNRLQHLPLILAGPILRRTESDAVTVWVALKSPREVTLNIYATEDKGTTIETLLLSASRSTVPLGKHLHVIAVTAKPVSNQQLQPGRIYAYDLRFGHREPNLTQALNSSLPTPVTISYFNHQLPTFALPPDNLNDLRVAHGSCRKLHSSGEDALPIIDDLIEYYAHQPNSRIHQLFFTGDQIYADDVADPLLWVATEAGDTLLGWEENLPLKPNSSNSYEYKKPSQLKPGERSDIAKDCGGFTAMLIDSPEKAKSHLLSLGEYCATYILCWSPILWPDSLPKGKEIYQNPQQAKQWNQEVSSLQDFVSKLWKVRRAMANVPTYMVFDDHDISDDWYLNRAWCNSVLGKPLGRRVVQNGLLAYAVFQAWGNTPEQFQKGQAGGNLLEAVKVWSASAGTTKFASEEISKYLGLPQSELETGLPQLKLDRDFLILDRDYQNGIEPIKWHYALKSFKHEVIVLDVRTWRGYPQGEDNEIAPPWLLSPQAFQEQIQKPLEQTSESEIEVTFLIAPTNLVSLQIIDLVQQRELEKGIVFKSDVGDAWNFNELALSKLLAELFQRRKRVVVLSGDIHYSGAVRLSYWFGSNYRISDTELEADSNQISRRESTTQNSKARVLAQLTASPFKNSELKTHFIHTKIKSLVPEPTQDWAGWSQPPQLVEVLVTPGAICRQEVEVPKTGPMVRQIRRVCGNWGLTWNIVPKDRNSLPDWQYHIEWIKRLPAILAPWEEKLLSREISENQSHTKLLSKVGNLVYMLWRNRWLQEGEEVVGRNNFGLISFEWSSNREQERAVIQDIYWRSTWKPNTVVYSRYCVPLYQLPPRRQS